MSDVENIKEYLKGLEKCEKMLRKALEGGADLSVNRSRIAYVRGYLLAAYSHLANLEDCTTNKTKDSDE